MLKITFQTTNVFSNDSFPLKQDDNFIHDIINKILSVMFQSQMLLTGRILTVCTFFFIRRLGIIIFSKNLCIWWDSNPHSPNNIHLLLSFQTPSGNFQTFQLFSGSTSYLLHIYIVCRVGVEPTIPYSVSNRSQLADITTQTIKGYSRNSCSHCKSIVVLPTSPCQSGATLPFVHRHIYF